MVIDSVAKAGPMASSLGASPVNVVTLAVGLLAFTIALYALVARDQRSPYLTNPVFGTSLTILISILLALAEDFVGSGSGSLVRTLHVISYAALAGASLFLLLSVVRLRNRRINFRDDYWRLSNYGAYRSFASAKRALSNKKLTYQHDPQPWPPDLISRLNRLDLPYIAEVEESLRFSESLRISSSPTVSLALACKNARQGDGQLVPLAECFLAMNCLVQYMSCSRHPLAFITELERKLGTEWASVRGSVTAIDGYTPHFGFTDSVYDKAEVQLRNLGVEVIRSSPSYAGMHTASAKAFNAAMDRAKAARGQDALRRPTLVIYDGARELVDIESEEQYRLFLRHVIPSEKHWGGMLTLFLEYRPSDVDRDLLKSYADVYVGLDEGPTT